MADKKLDVQDIAKGELYEFQVNDHLVINIKCNSDTYDVTVCSTNDSILESVTVYEADYGTYSDTNDCPSNDNEDDDYDEDYEDAD